MNVDSTTTVYELVSTYPYLLDWLVTRDAHFENLRNPAMFQTVARFASLDHVADTAGVDT